MDGHHTPGTALIFCFDEFVEFFLFTVRCLFHILELLLFYVFMYLICVLVLPLESGHRPRMEKSHSCWQRTADV